MHAWHVTLAVPGAAHVQHAQRSWNGGLAQGAQRAGATAVAASLNQPSEHSSHAPRWKKVRLLAPGGDLYPGMPAAQLLAKLLVPLALTTMLHVTLELQWLRADTGQRVHAGPP